jgi:GT2 family glycosyltransferase
MFPTARIRIGGHNRVRLVSSPDVSVVVPSRGRAGRLRTLLDALAAQTLDRSRFEVVVVHDYDEDPTAGYDFARGLRQEPGLGDAARRRNAGWRAARTRLIAFTDDDCVPAPGWLAGLLAAAERHPGAIVQGTTRPDPAGATLLRATFVRTVDQTPPHWWAQTANILYPRELLERVGGLDERIGAGEDADLALRARATGAAQVPAHDALVHHEVRALTAGEMISENRRWESLVLFAKLNPAVRRYLPLRVFWKIEHPYALLAAAGLLGAARRPVLLALCLPYLVVERKRKGTGLADRALAMRQAPVRLLVDLAEIATFARASVRHRTLVL